MTDETKPRTFEVRVEKNMPLYFQADEIKIVDGVICLCETNPSGQSTIVAAFSSAVVSVCAPEKLDTQEANTAKFVSLGR